MRNYCTTNLMSLLEFVGLKGVDEISGPDISRLSSVNMFYEVQNALEFAKASKQPNRVIPEVRALDLLELSRRVSASRTKRGDEIISQIDEERMALYKKIAEAAGATAVEEARSANQLPNHP